MHLLELVSVLRDAVPKTRSFNVFSAIRCESDEVFLHSRLIAALIDNKCHGFAEEALTALLTQFGIYWERDGDFIVRGAQVRTEYRGVDILITNDAGQAIIIENKIYASDQPKQLRRYYDMVRGMGYSNIYVRYLTLDGREPSPQSLDGLEKQLAPPWLGCASYGSEIRRWLDEVAAIAVRETALRETVFQYQEVVDRLTGQGKEKNYMSELVNTLLRGNNIVLARDVSNAYTQALAELQDRFWLDLIETFRTEHPTIFQYIVQKSVADPGARKAAVSKYYEPGKKDKMYFGVCLSVPGYESAEVWLQIERALYAGVTCEKGRFASKEYRHVAQTLKEQGIGGESNDEWPLWRFIRADHNFQQPDEDLLTVLSDTQQRKEFTVVCSNAVAEIWHALVKVPPTKKIALASAAAWPFPGS